MKMKLFYSLQQSVLGEQQQQQQQRQASSSSSSSSKQYGDADEHSKEQLLLANLLADLYRTSLPAGPLSRSTNSSSSSSTTNSISTAAFTPASILKCLGQLTINGIATTAFLTSSVEERRGLGLYPVTALFNHDCRPNCSIRCVSCPTNKGGQLQTPITAMS
jgi:hypothetical protein